ncbi:alpha/beta-hydrolase [Trametes elegans]|nr:alpha/beta-hydrolase [Trametes elegans]
MASTTAEEQPFTLAVPDADLELLRTKLASVRFPDELEGAAWDYGAPLADIQRLVTHWKNSFDWRKAEAAINTLPMFTHDIEVDGFGTLNIHYVHQKSAVKNAVPLLFVHGWPGHFLEVRKLLPLLTAGPADQPSFHVVALSLPGFGFSEAPKKPGFKGRHYAEVFNKLMLSLGYEEYVYQGGDWGCALGAHAVTHYAHTHIKAWHTNTPFYRRPKFLSNPLLFLGLLTLPFNEPALAGLQRSQEFMKKGMGYYMEQATQPQTLGYSLADSPVGLLAWIYEKLVSWSDDYPWTDDEVIEWISIYWFSRAGPAAAGRIYYEITNRNTNDLFEGTKRTTVPFGVAYFPGEIAQTPKSWSKMLGKVVFESTHDKGGHFSAFEQPEKLASDLHKMFGKGGPAHGVVPGRNGYD